MNIDHSPGLYDELMKVLVKRVAMEFDKNYYAKLLVAIEEKSTELASELVDICAKRRMLRAAYNSCMYKYMTGDGTNLSSEEKLKRISDLDKLRRASPILYKS